MLQFDAVAVASKCTIIVRIERNTHVSAISRAATSTGRRSSSCTIRSTSLPSSSAPNHRRCWTHAMISIRRWRVTGRPVMFPNFFLGEQYEHASKNNRLISSIVPTGYFRKRATGEGLAIEPGDLFPLPARAPAASSMPATRWTQTLRSRGVSTLVMASASASTGVVLFRGITWAGAC